MGKTIIQTIGPLYGESVNGTVFGRPNGSVYVPSTNTVTVRGSGNIVELDGTVRTLTNFDFIAESQDLASYVRAILYSDSGLTTAIADRTFVAGSFNFSLRNIAYLYEGKSLTPGEKYYLVAYLVNNGSNVATSSVLELVAS